MNARCVRSWVVSRLLRPDLLFRFLTLLQLRCTASLTPRRFERCLRCTAGNAAAVTLTFFWKDLLAFCLAELHLISVLRRFSYMETVCCALKLRLHKLLCLAFLQSKRHVCCIIYYFLRWDESMNNSIYDFLKGVAVFWIIHFDRPTLK